VSWGQSATPESFGTLAETVSPAVVNISTVKTIKGGGPVFRHFHQNPWGDQDPFIGINTAIIASGQGDDKGIQMIDIIKDINHKPPSSVDDYNNAIHKVKKGDTVSMFIQRANSGFFVIKLTKE
jgi:S1-C subfamily serine protease